ncbi:MAG: hypothetical protein J1F42_09565 [Lachnospiraceae bacterium]|nr:hypothetical protein [Lachnospiraceae bacterium]
MDTEYLYSVGNSLIALSIALAIFLSEYLLYRYDHDEYSADEHINNDGEEYDQSGYHGEDDMRK